MQVTAFFDVEQNSFKVQSGFNKYGAPYCNIFEIVDGNDVDLTKSSIIETRRFIEAEVLHCDISIFLRTILLSSDQNYNFFRLRKGEKKEFIEKLFDISVFGDMYNSIHRDILDMDKSIISHQNKLTVLNNTNVEYKERIEKYDLDKKNNIISLNDALTKLKAKQEEIRNLKIANNSAEIDKYNKAIDKLNEAVGKLKDD